MLNRHIERCLNAVQTRALSPSWLLLPPLPPTIAQRKLICIMIPCPQTCQAHSRVQGLCICCPFFLGHAPWNPCTLETPSWTPSFKRVLQPQPSIASHSVSFSAQAFLLYYIVRMYVLSRFSPVQLFATLWTVAHQALLSMEFSRWEYWSGLSCSPLGDLLNSGIKPMSFMSPALADRLFCFFFFTTTAACEAITLLICFLSACLPDENTAAWAWTLAHEVYGSVPKTGITFEMSQQTLNIHLLNWWICEWINKYVNTQLIATVWRANYQKIISALLQKIMSREI